MRTCTHFRKFLDFDSSFPQSRRFQANKIATMQDFKQGVRDFIYLPQY